MGIFTKNEKKEKEPQYYLSVTHIPALNYSVYYMSKLEKVLYFLVAFAAGAIVGYLFYGGIAKDEYGNPTAVTKVLDVLIPVVVGSVAGYLFIPVRTQQIINKRKRMLAAQFRDMLDGITTSLGAGNNVMNSFSAVYDDLKLQYPEDAFIVKELEIVLSGMQSNFNVEDLLENLGQRSANDDILSFANVFKICYRKGGNIQDVVRSTHEILSSKMEITREIEATVSGSKMNQIIMIILPICLVGIIKVMSPEFAANFVTGTGLIATTIAIGLFVAAYYVGRKIMDIKV